MTETPRGVASDRPCRSQTRWDLLEALSAAAGVGPRTRRPRTSPLVDRSRGAQS